MLLLLSFEYKKIEKKKSNVRKKQKD